MKKDTKKISRENIFTAYIMKGNKQILKVNVNASKRFRVNEDTYIIKPECIFTRINKGKLESESYYSEGNPNPHDFKSPKNVGLEYEEFNRLYGEDLYNMLVKLQQNTRMFYLLMLYVVVMIVSIVTLISGVV